MTTRELFHLAYGAARAAARDEERTHVYRSPLVAALDATLAHHTPMRYAVAAYAERVTSMPRSYRLRRCPYSRSMTLGMRLSLYRRTK